MEFVDPKLLDVNKNQEIPELPELECQDIDRQDPDSDLRYSKPQGVEFIQESDFERAGWLRASTYHNSAISKFICHGIVSWGALQHFFTAELQERLLCLPNAITLLMKIDPEDVPNLDSDIDESLPDLMRFAHQSSGAPKEPLFVAMATLVFGSAHPYTLVANDIYNESLKGHHREIESLGDLHLQVQNKQSLDSAISDQLNSDKIDPYDIVIAELLVHPSVGQCDYGSTLVQWFKYLAEKSQTRLVTYTADFPSQDFYHAQHFERGNFVQLPNNKKGSPRWRFPHLEFQQMIYVPPKPTTESVVNLDFFDMSDK